MWTNLIDNAVDAMSGAGVLTVTTRRDNSSVVVEIADTGPGIPPELQRRIFEPFFTTKGVGQGTGLGLDMSYRIVVRRHHGDIRVESAPGNTRFLVTLPVDQPSGPSPSHNRRRQRVRRSTEGKVARLRLAEFERAIAIGADTDTSRYDRSGQAGRTATSWARWLRQDQ